MSDDAFLPVLSNEKTREISGGATLLENMAVTFSLLAARLGKASPAEVRAFLSPHRNPKE